ncbi:putative duf1479 domain-containing protein [Phaeoacremonium minimum UCRPA7]|uniref:Putative duf1479 domain-containing protein n=1 Tax=Phaeoacremonium minimum (strain UCR-PA7) TaxID=1286976 RepID=R8BFZ0_PHAM7|nr:putative duf1479 domain-containing protein [Phaeoacremonium minimum UCRPA7]EON98231.1 putative duf1479 domain-containing protein [Phaeoacremonium minimum UCRPA7]
MTAATITVPTTIAASSATASASASAPASGSGSPIPGAGSAIASGASVESSPAANTNAAAALNTPQQYHPPGTSRSQHRISKPNRKVFAKINNMDPPVQSFYGSEPIPLPTRFANIKRRLIQGKETAVMASWRRLLAAIKSEVAHIQAHGTDLIPIIDFADIDDPAKVAPFERSLKRYGVAVVRGVVSSDVAENWIRETREYITKNRDQIKPPPPQDPTCFDLFWTPAQVAIRAHPSVLGVQKWAMSFWETKGADADLSRIATRFPISYADRLRIHDSSIMGSNAPPVNGNSAADSLQASAGSTLIAQVDSGSLERWEPDGYGRGGAYEAIFRGDWEEFDPWDPAGRVGVTPDLYNGDGCCSIFRMFQGVLALTSGEPASIRVLPSPKLVVAYLLLRPFFSSKTKLPALPDDESASPETVAEWEAFLDPDNWTLDSEQTTVIHGAVPGHAQRITELWHPHLRLRKSLVEIPTLRAGDYVIWHCDEAYSILTAGASKPGTPSRESSSPSMLMYTPACPLTQTNALFLARQRKAFLLGQPGPDFDSIGSSLGTEAPHEGRPGKDEIAAVGGQDGLRAMGLAPWELDAAKSGTAAVVSKDEDKDDKMDLDSDRKSISSRSDGEAEVVRLANIILFPDRYDFYIPTEATDESKPRINGRAQAEQMAATRQLIARVLS